MIKPRVLIVNKFYYPRGGDCVCTLNLEYMLHEQGHKTAIYAMTYPENLDSCWSKYFADEVKFGGSVSDLIKGMKRTLGLGDIKKSFQQILADFKPDIVHLNNVHSYLSPVLAEMAHKQGARVVWTLHDYKLLCPSYSCLRDGKPCEECFTNKWDVVEHKCMKHSLPASVLSWLEAKKWNRKRLEKYTDTFICPSRFMKSKMIEGGYDTDKLEVLCNFVDPVKLATLISIPTIQRKPDTYAYIGRLSSEKGVAELLETAARLPQYHLEVAGDGPMLEDLKNHYDSCPNITFHGRLGAKEVAQLLTTAYATIIPSRWYENNPLGVIESLCAGTPVIGADIGGIPELIDPTSGRTYTWNDTEAMKQAIIGVMSQPWDNKSIADQSNTRFSAATHYQALQKIYNML